MNGSRLVADEIGVGIEKPVVQAITFRQANQGEEEHWRRQREQLVAVLEALEAEEHGFVLGERVGQSSSCDMAIAGRLRLP